MTNEITTTSILSLFETTKDQRKSFVDDVISRVENGDIDPIKTLVQVKAMEDICNRLTSKNEKTNKDNFVEAKKFNALLIESAEKYGSKTFQAFNGKFEIKETGVKYDFSKCEDQVLIALYEKQKQIDSLVKERESFLKTVPQKGMIVTDEESGETFTVYPPSKSSSTTLATSLL